MSAQVISPDYNWKEAATREGVDYDAVQKAFMDQAYGMVANKAKILFQDPFRLGFEIVHRNEKATKMVGIFAFRVDKELLYAPCFFVNGENKPCDMLFRSSVKRFTALTEDWCAYLVRGVKERSGELVDKGRRRQSDAYLDRLAYPQRVKYASAEAPSEDADMEAARAKFVKEAQDGTIMQSLLAHSADATPMRKLLADVINENGPPALEKLASLVEDSAPAQRFLAENYSKEDLEVVDKWMAKKAAAEDQSIGTITINMDPMMAKSAAEREVVFDKGYGLSDNRKADSVNVVVEEITNDVVKELSSCAAANVFLDGGETEKAVLFQLNEYPFDDHDCVAGGIASDRDVLKRPDAIYFPGSKEFMRLKHDQCVFGEDLIDSDDLMKPVGAKKLKVGKSYSMVDLNKMKITDPFVVEDKSPSGDSTKIEVATRWGGSSELIYAPGREGAKGNYISDEAVFLPVEIEPRDKSDSDSPAALEDVVPTCEKVLMTSSGVDKWMRTAGGIAESSDVRVTSTGDGRFDITHMAGSEKVKSAHDLNTLSAHLMLAEDFDIRTDIAGDIIDRASKEPVAYRIFNTVEKKAYVTRAEGMQDWIESYDPELQVKLDTPQQQVLGTYTPERQKQVSRYGDTYQGARGENSKEMQDVLPESALHSKSPEELAQISQTYDMPHIFDHGCIEQMASTSYSIIEQIKQYIPDLESGVDRMFRILFLLRYRPSDFEEAYGKDALLEMEQELAELSGQSAANLLRLLQRFEVDQYSSQED